MPLAPDTEIQYRRGGKIMKKSPRKFQAGGATPAPATKPASKGGPKELQEEAEKVRQAKLDEAQRKAGQQRPDLSKPFKKGGKVRKFSGEDESFVGSSDAAIEPMREVREDLRSGSPEAQRKEYMAKKARPLARRPSPRVSVSPSKRAEEAPKAAAKSETKSEAPSESLSQGLGRKFAATESAFRSAPAGTSPIAYAALKKARDDAESAYSKSVESERTGKSVVKMAKGGGVESKGKTKGKIVKMAKGGSVRGYGISKVTNKTKYV